MKEAEISGEKMSYYRPVAGFGCVYSWVLSLLGYLSNNKYTGQIAGDKGWTISQYFEIGKLFYFTSQKVFLRNLRGGRGIPFGYLD